jgi:hypothetical protein
VTNTTETGAAFRDAQKRRIRVILALNLDGEVWVIEGHLERRQVDQGVGAIARTMDMRERDLAGQIVLLLHQTLRARAPEGASSLDALRASFDERVVARHLESYYSLRGDLGRLFVALRKLAEQSYENKSLAFGCIIKPSKRDGNGPRFPQDFLERKPYRALSDGYNTGTGCHRPGFFLVSFIWGREEGWSRGFTQSGLRTWPPRRSGKILQSR